MKYLAILGRLEKLSLAELESVFSGVKLVKTDFIERGANFRKKTANGEEFESKLALFSSEEKPNISRFGGVLKFAEELPNDFNSLVEFLAGLPEGKITLGVSDFCHGTTTHKAQCKALKLKALLRRRGRSVRVLENKSPILSTATSHHNQLAEKKNHVEIILTEFGNFNLIGVQNISNYAKRDQARPARDAKVGMLPPKLAQILLNLTGNLPKGARILDPFCGTGVVLQEAFLSGLTPYGTDLNPRMVEYSRRNLQWIGCDNFQVEVGDATNFNWSGEIDAVVAEGFLGTPMSMIPSDIKLKEEKIRCIEIVRGCLKNLTGQLKTDTPVVLAIPAWLRKTGKYEGLKILDEVEELGYNVVKFENVRQEELLYFRKGQIVAREIIVLRKK